jgi:cell division protease FtsH
LNNLFKNLAIWLVIGVVLMTVFNQFNNRQAAQNSVEYSQFMEDAKQGKVAKAVVDGRTVRATTQDGRQVTVYTPGVQDIWMVGDLMRYGVKVTAAKPEEEQSFLMNIFVSWFPMIPVDWRMGFLHAPDAGGRARRGIFLWQVEGKDA